MCGLDFDTKRDFVISYKFLSCLSLQKPIMMPYIIDEVHDHTFRNFFFQNDFYWPVALYGKENNSEHQCIEIVALLFFFHLKYPRRHESSILNYKISLKFINSNDIYYDNNNTKRITVPIHHKQIGLIFKYNSFLSKSASGDIFKNFLSQ